MPPVFDQPSTLHPPHPPFHTSHVTPADPSELSSQPPPAAPSARRRTRRSGGRPRVLDDAKRREICALISAGCTLDGAARYVGCAPSTIRREALRNPEFEERLRRADLATEISLLQAIRKAATKYWRAAVWMLEHSDPQRFGRQPIKVLKPEMISAYASLIGLVLADEIRDPDLLRRINKRLGQICLHATREGEAAARNPFYPKRPKLPTLEEVAPSPEPDDNRRPADDSVPCFL